jgi:hypothetical protein
LWKLLQNFIPLLWGDFKAVKSTSTRMHPIDDFFRVLGRSFVCMYVCICVENLIAPPLLRLHCYLCFMKLVISSTMLTTYLNWLWKNTFYKVVTHMWYTLYVNVFFFLKCNHVVDEVDIDEGCQKYADESKFYQDKDV